MSVSTFTAARSGRERVNRIGVGTVGGERTSDPLNAQVGTPSDYDQLYIAHRARIFRLCRLLLTDRDEAEEVCQEVFLKLLQEHRRGDRTIAWAPWLTRVTINACRDRRRSGWWKWWRERHEDFDAVDWPAGGATPEELVMRSDQRQRIWAAFRMLPARQQEVFVLRFVEGWPTDAAAATLGLSPGTVKRHLFRAVQHLRRALGGQD